MSYEQARKADDTTPLVDWHERLRLDGDDILTACVERDGSTSLWVIRALDEVEGEVTHGCACDAVHEQVGPLPPAVQHRLDVAVRPRCGHPTAEGHPCRQQVGQVGDRCRWHRDARARQVTR